ncbi:uncharacterized protein DS421_7g216470 [Arachis hypogaea]|nr:uncharacterized protein DS421_7g216470 [Arachis hypogaea]
MGKRDEEENGSKGEGVELRLEEKVSHVAATVQPVTIAPSASSPRRAEPMKGMSDGCHGLGGRHAFVAIAPTPRRYCRPHYIAAVELASVEEAQHHRFRQVFAIELVSTAATDHTLRERGCTNRSRREVAVVTAWLGSPLWKVTAFPPPLPKVHHQSCWAHRMLLWCRRSFRPLCWPPETAAEASGFVGSDCSRRDAQVPDSILLLHHSVFYSYSSCHRMRADRKRVHVA